MRAGVGIRREGEAFCSGEKQQETFFGAGAAFWAGVRLVVVVVGVAKPGWCQPAGGWFVPPPPSKSSVDGTRPNVDMRQVGSHEDITVTATRKATQRDPHGAEVQEYEARRNEASSPEQGSPSGGACEGAAYQTIGGQAATGADLIGMGGGRC